MKKIILMLLLVFNLMASEGFEEDFGPLLRVGITRFQSANLYVKSDNGSFVVKADDSEFLVQRGVMQKFSVSKGKIIYNDVVYDDVSIQKVEGNTLLALSKDNYSYGRFRGEFDLKVVSSKIMPVNKVYAEEYLYSVVPSEIGNSFPEEAIKAQSVAARSYLYFNLDGSKYSYCDLLDNVNSQMYLGYDKENGKINSLVNATYDEILVYNGKVIQALFHSTSGGKTASNEDVWPSGKPIPYLRSVDDTDNGTISPKQNWVLEVTKTELSRIAGFAVDTLNILETGEGRVKYVELLGSLKKKMTGEELRRALGVNRLNSTLFNIKDSEDKVIFEGNGFGHGLGMPQYSAYTMAQKGKTYKDILTYYYTGVQLKKVKE